MACRVETDPARGLTIARAEGAIGVEDIFSAIELVWREPAYQKQPCVLWDLRQADVEHLYSPELREIVGRERRERPSLQRSRMAFLVASDVGFGMARMMEVLVEGEPIDVHVFRDDEEAAWRWLSETEEGDRS